jgi:hypothetical protein
VTLYSLHTAHSAAALILPLKIIRYRPLCSFPIRRKCITVNSPARRNSNSHTTTTSLVLSLSCLHFKLCKITSLWSLWKWHGFKAIINSVFFYRLTLWGIFSILRSFKTIHVVTHIYPVFRFLFKRLSFPLPLNCAQLHRNACFCERKTGHFNSAFTKPQLLFYICTWINIKSSATFIKLLNKTYFLD